MIGDLKYRSAKDKNRNNRPPVLEIPPLNIPVQQNKACFGGRFLNGNRIVGELGRYFIPDRSYLFCVLRWKHAYSLKMMVNLFFSWTEGAEGWGRGRRGFW